MFSPLNPHPSSPDQLSLLPLLSKRVSPPARGSKRRGAPGRQWPAWLESIAIILAVVAFGFAWIGLEAHWGVVSERSGRFEKDAEVELSSPRSWQSQGPRLTGHLPRVSELADSHGLIALADPSSHLADRRIQRSSRGNAPS